MCVYGLLAVLTNGRSISQSASPVFRRVVTPSSSLDESPDEEEEEEEVCCCHM